MNISNKLPKIITFDCYGTLVQYREVLLVAVAQILRRRSTVSVDPAAILTTFSRHSRRLEQQAEHLPYKTILRKGFTAAFSDHHIETSQDDIEEVAESIKRMGPHPDTVSALTQLRSHYRLAIFTNSDDDLIEHNVRLLGVPIDFVITAEQAGAYKPSPLLFEHAYRVMGVRKDETVHVAMGMDLDIQACHNLGVRAIWINRLQIQGEERWKPYEELPDLNRLPKLLQA